MTEALIETRSLTTEFAGRRRFLGRRPKPLRAVDSVDLAVPAGSVLSVVGESGSGKTTLGKTMLKLVPATSGQIVFEGRDITHLPASQMRPISRRMQLIFQDPASALNPRQTIRQILSAPFEIHGETDGAEIVEKVAELLTTVGLEPEAMRRYPHEFSGGQKQRIGIARSIALRPRLIVGDEPTSALDVSIQAQIINLLQRLQSELKLTYIFISHNLRVVSHISDVVAVMYLGQIVEIGPRDAVFFDARHPYTQALLAAIPGQRNESLQAKAVDGDTHGARPSGCPFHPRCKMAIDICSVERPASRHFGNGHRASCHLC